MKETSAPMFAAFAAMLTAGMSIAQDSKHQGYLVDSYGHNIVTSPNTGLCWRPSEWTPTRAAESCDPAIRNVEVPTPGIVAAAPPQKRAAAPVAAPPSMVPQSINFSTDALFAFDQFALKPEGRALLGDFARQLSGAKYEVVFVTGYTDRLGGNEYNQQLSERRANAVKDYLVGKDVPATGIKVEGRGKTQPVTAPGDCKGAQSVNVIACLQPDRRVHAAVTGAKVLITSH